MYEFTFSDLKIFEALATNGPRNISRISRILNIPPETLRKKIKRISSQTFLRFNINVYHTNLGLKKAVVFAESIPGYEDVLFQALKINDFWIFLSRCYGMFEGCTGIFTIPKENCHLFEDYINQFKEIGIAKNTEVYWSTCFQYIPLNLKYFDHEANVWIFDWDRWLKEVEEVKANLPYTLLDPKDFPLKADYIDLFILKELEKDATTTFKDIADKLGVSPQLVRYHYYNHVIREGLLESFEIGVFHFGSDAEFLFFIFSFEEWEKLAKFASLLMDKPFVRTLGKILGQNKLYGYLYLPRNEFRKFLDALSKLIKRGFLKTYQYAIQDLNNSLRATIPYECFKDGRWLYKHEEYLQNLKNLVDGNFQTFIKITN